MNERQQPWNTFRLRAAVSVSDMARAVGLSRSQFYTYIKRNVFPHPVYSLRTRRPHYLADQQQEIVEVRATGIGMNGEYVMFYEGRHEAGEPAFERQRSHTRASDARPKHTELIEGLRSLGMAKTTVEEVEQALTLLFPNGTAGKEPTDLLPPVYRHLRRQGLG